MWTYSVLAIRRLLEWTGVSCVSPLLTFCFFSLFFCLSFTRPLDNWLLCFISASLRLLSVCRCLWVTIRFFSFVFFSLFPFIVSSLLLHKLFLLLSRSSSKLRPFSLNHELLPLRVKVVVLFFFASTLILQPFQPTSSRGQWNVCVCTCALACACLDLLSSTFHSCVEHSGFGCACSTALMQGVIFLSMIGHNEWIRITFVFWSRLKVKAGLYWFLSAPVRLKLLH